MKYTKGQINYLNESKKQAFILCMVQWGLIIALIVAGILIFDKFINVLTIIAVLGIYPALKSLAKVLLKKKFKTMSDEILFQLDEAREFMTVVYHPILTSRDKLMGFECVVISGSTVLGYSSYEEVDLEFATAFIRTILTKHRVDCGNIKLFSEFKPFMDRVEGLQNMLSIAPSNDREVERKIRAIILKFSI